MFPENLPNRKPIQLSFPFMHPEPTEKTVTIRDVANFVIALQIMLNRAALALAPVIRKANEISRVWATEYEAARLRAQRNTT